MNAADRTTIAAVIDRARLRLLWATITRGLLRWLVVVGGVVIAIMLLDNLLRLPAALRLTLSIGVFAFALAALGAWVVGPFARRRSAESVAFLIERLYGIGDNSLVGALQFERLAGGAAADGVQRSFVAETERLGREALGSIRTNDLVEGGRLLAWAGGFAAVVAAWAAYASLAPLASGTALRRFILPLADVPPASAVRIFVTVPEGLVVPEGSDVAVEVRVEGPSSGRYPEIVWVEDAATVDVDDPAALRAGTEPDAERDRVFSHTFRGLRHDVSFRASADGTYSELVKVTVVPAPAIVASSFAVTPPAYSGLETAVVAGPPQMLDVLEGSRVTVQIELDEPVQSLTWRLGSDEVACVANEGRWKAEAVVGKVESYSLDARIDRMPKPLTVARGRVTCRQDRSPEVRFVTDRLSLRAELGSTLPIEIAARDDLGVMSLDLSVRGGSGDGTVVRQWSYPSPGASGEITESTPLELTPDLFVVGGRYVVEASARDARADVEPAVTRRPLLVEIVATAAGPPAKEEGGSGFFAALDRAIAVQKRALDATRSLAANLPELWVDLSRKPRPQAEVDALLEQYRSAVLEPQRQVRAAIFEAAGSDGADVKAAKRLRELAAVEAAACGEAAAELTVPGVELKGAGEQAGRLAVPAGSRQVVAFPPRKATWLSLVVRRTGDWVDGLDLRGIGVHGSPDGPPLELKHREWTVKSILPAGDLNAATASLRAHGQVATPGHMPCAVIIDLGAPIDVAGVSAMSVRNDVDIMEVYAGGDGAPEFVVEKRDERLVARQIRLLEPIQAALYAELVTLRGRELKRAGGASERQPEESIESAPLAGDGGREAMGELAEWTEEFEKVAQRRKNLTDRPPESLTAEEQEELELMAIAKQKLARRLQRITEDHSDAMRADFGDSQQMEARMRLAERLENLAELAELSASKSRKKETTYNLDAAVVNEAKEILNETENQKKTDVASRGKIESGDDEQTAAFTQQLATMVEFEIPELAKKFDAADEGIEKSASEMASLDTASGPVLGGPFSINSAVGRPGDATPDQSQTNSGKSTGGRSGPSDGQMVGNSMPSIPDEEVTSSDRRSDTPLEKGKVADDSESPETSTGLGKPSSRPAQYGREGRMPPELLNMMGRVVGDVESVARGTSALALRLERMNMPSTDLRVALRHLELAQAQAARGNGVGVRQAFSDAREAFDRGRRAASEAIAQMVATRRRDEARKLQGQFDERIPVPTAYDEMVSAYFKAVAERATSQAAEGGGGR